MKENFIYLPLTIDGEKLHFCVDDVLENCEQINRFLEDESFMSTRGFVSDIFGRRMAEVQANNSVEGYNDDISSIIQAIYFENTSIEPNTYSRIVNLFRGYQYIFKNPEINKDNLRELYSILSANLIPEEDKPEEGKYYRSDPVFIHISPNLSKEPLKGVDPSRVDSCMNDLFDYINSNNEGLSPIESFLKSQIIHFYFVYVHPYYDVNGRTSRTTAMWYLLNQGDYPFIIFNRAIQYDKTKYYKVIRQVLKTKDIGVFLNYMLKNIQLEFEREHFMQTVIRNSHEHMTPEDMQTLHMILNMKEIKSFGSFAKFYQNNSKEKHKIQIYHDNLVPLIDKGLILVGRQTKRRYTTIKDNENGERHVMLNQLFDINTDLYYSSGSPEKVKHLHL